MIESYGLNDQPACVSLTYQRTCQSPAVENQGRSGSERKRCVCKSIHQHHKAEHARLSADSRCATHLTKRRKASSSYRKMLSRVCLSIHLPLSLLEEGVKLNR